MNGPRGRLGKGQEDLNALDALLFSKAQEFKDLIQKSMDRKVTIN
jgi:hypothetical protein